MIDCVSGVAVVARTTGCVCNVYSNVTLIFRLSDSLGKKLSVTRILILIYFIMF